MRRSAVRATQAERWRGLRDPTFDLRFVKARRAVDGSYPDAEVVPARQRQSSRESLDERSQLLLETGSLLDLPFVGEMKRVLDDDRGAIVHLRDYVERSVGWWLLVLGISHLRYRQTPLPRHDVNRHADDCTLLRQLRLREVTSRGYERDERDIHNFRSRLRRDLGSLGRLDGTPERSVRSPPRWPRSAVRRSLRHVRERRVGRSARRAPTRDPCAP